jgi:PAS domain-containing protein
MIGVMEDVTEQRIAADRLRDSEERLRRFGDASQDVLWIRDARTLQWAYLTPAFEAI